MQSLRKQKNEAVAPRDDALHPSALDDFVGAFMRLKERLRIAVIFAGDKQQPDSVIYAGQNTRSWKSYEAVAEDIAAALRRVGFRTVLTVAEDMRLGERLRYEGIHFAWLNTGGVQGRNPMAHAPATLEMIGIPYIGHDPATITALDNKDIFKRMAEVAGIPTAPFSTWSAGRSEFNPAADPHFRRAFGDYSGPFIVKPVSGRASLHVHFVGNRAELTDAVWAVHAATKNRVLIEQYLPGREFCVAVAGPIRCSGESLRRENGPFAFSVLERLFAPGEMFFTSMDTQPITERRFHRLHGNTERGLVRDIAALGRSVFLDFDLQSLIRLDIRSDQMGRLFVLEANPKPDLKRPAKGVTSLVCEGLAEQGMDYDDLIQSLIADRLYSLLYGQGSPVPHIAELVSATPGAAAATASRSALISDHENGHDGGRIAAHKYPDCAPTASTNTAFSDFAAKLDAFVNETNAQSSSVGSSSPSSASKESGGRLFPDERPEP